MIKTSYCKGLFCWLTLICISVNAYTQEVPKIRVNPAQAYGGTVSEYFDDIKYIPLETTKESLFGYISRLIVTDSSFVIYDKDTYSMLFFNLSGKFITKIKGREDSIGEDIEYNESQNCIQFSRGFESTHQRETEQYTKLGSLIKKRKPEATKLFEELYMLPLGNGYYAYGDGGFIPNLNKVKDTTLYRVKIYNGENLYNSLLPINQKENEAICAINGFLLLPESVENHGFYISTPLDYYVYHVTKDTAKVVFQFVFPADRVFANEILQSHNKELITSIAKTYFSNPDPLKIMNVSNIFYKGNNLFFKINPRKYVAGEGSDIENQYNFIYNTNSGKLVSLERLVGDDLNYFLPIFNERVRVDGLLKQKNSNYYSNISSFKMFAAYEATKDKNPKYPVVLQNYFKTENRKSNPVIVSMKLKD